MAGFDPQPMIDAITEIVAEVAPDAVAAERYGGTVFEAEPGVHRSMFCGIFAFCNHVGLEFSHGAELDDPAGLLEGGGRYRRHLKLRTVEDIAAKHVADFVAEAWDEVSRR